MFEIHLIVFLDLINIYTDTKTIKIEAFIANLQAHPVFRAAILNFEFLAGKPGATIWFPLFLNSAYSKTPRCKFSCFYPEVHDMAEKCHISAPLYVLEKKCKESIQIMQTVSCACDTIVLISLNLAPCPHFSCICCCFVLFC